jgi:hypothetical protein
MMKSVFAALSALGMAGFVASLLVHICALLQYPSLFGKWVWALHIGIFPSFFILVIYADKTKPAKSGRNNFSHLMKQLPPWVTKVSTAFVVYALLNFAVFIYQTTQYPKKGVPEWLIQRGFSGHWLIFHGAIFCGFWGLYLLRAKDEARPKPAIE